MSLLELINSSKSLNKLREINSKIIERKFHEHTHLLYDIRTLIGKDKKIYMEIGSYIGSSASLLLQHPYQTQIVCIDPLNLSNKHFNGSKTQKECLENNMQKFNIFNRNYEIIQGYSTDKKIIDQCKKYKIDILFIDGDHSYKGVLKDWQNYETLVNIGGYIIFDDYLDHKHSPEVRVAVDDIVKNLDRTKYEIIGSLPNLVKAYSQIPREYSNEFIIKKLQ